MEVMRMTKKIYKIKDIVSGRKGIEVLVDDLKFPLNTNDYLDGYYYPGKELSHEEYQILKRKSRTKKAKDYLLLLLSSRPYTKKELTEKLNSRFSLTADETDLLLRPFIEEGIIDDRRYASDYAEAKMEQGHGRKYIISELKKKGISEEILSSLAPLFESQKDVLPSLMERLDRSHRSSTIEKRKRDILAILLRRGYDMALSNEAIEKYYSSLDEDRMREENEKRRILIKKEADKCYNSISRKDCPAIRKKEMFIQKLMAKGFHHDEASAIIKEYSIHD